MNARWLALALLLFAPLAPAADFPNKPVRLLVPFTAGGGADLVARVIAQKLSEVWHQAVVVDNKPGAGGNIAAEIAATAPPDGYTLFQFNVANAIAPSVYRKLPYDPLKDFAPVTELAISPLVLMTSPGFRATTVQEVIALARAEPGRLNYGSSGTGGSTHLLGELFNSMAGTRITHIPYKGGAPGLADLLAGRVDLMFISLPAALPYMQSGKLRALGISSAHRSPLAPQVPTIAEAGIPGFAADAWYGIVAPANTPPEIVNQIAQDVRGVLAQRDVRDRFTAEGMEIVASTPDEFARFLRTDVERWRAVARTAHIEAE